MKPERKVAALNSLFQSIIFSVIFVLLGQYVGMLEKAKALKALNIPYTPAFSDLSFSFISFWSLMLIGTVVGFILCFWTPIIHWGLKLAFKMKAKPRSFWFAVIVGFLVSLILVIIFAPLMSILATVVLVPEGGHASTVSAALIGAAKYFWLFFPVAWFFAIILNPPCEGLARKILKIPVPDYSQMHKPETESVKE